MILHQEGFSVNRFRRFHVLGIMALVSALAACSGGPGSSPPTSVAPISPPTNPQGTNIQLTLANVNSPTQLPTVAGYGGTIGLPANNAPAGSTMALSISLGLPQGVPAIEQKLSSETSMLYFAMAPSHDVTFNQAPALSINPPSSVQLNGALVSVAYYDPGAGWSALGDATVANGAIVFTSGIHAMTLHSRITYMLALYSRQLIAGCPTPSPSPSPSPAPTSSVKPTPRPTATPTAKPTPTPAPTASPQSLYVSNDAVNPFVSVFAVGATGNVAPERTLSIPGTGCNGGGGLIGVALDSLQRLYASDQTECTDMATWVRVYAAGASGNTSFSRQIGGSENGNTDQVYNPQGLAIDRSGIVYVANDAGNVTGSNVTVYANGASTPMRTISGSNTGFATNPLQGLALDRTGDLAVVITNPNSCAPQSVAVFAPGANGNATPTRILAKGLCIDPRGDAFDSSGYLYVASFNANAILIYSPSVPSGGGVTREIVGSLTRLSNPVGVALDNKGHLFVANQGSNTITEYAPNVTGNVAPIATIAGSNTLLNVPSFLAIGP